MIPKLTIFTPTYNRENTLYLNYEALIRQTCKEFIWLIIDDGSIDNTKELVNSWINNDNGFEIQYIYKANAGLHTAYNTAVENINTELTVCIDSDDYMPDNAVEIILEFWQANGSDEFAGIIGLDFDTKGNVIGDYLPDQKCINLIDLLTGKYSIVNGDKKNVVRTKLYKQVTPMKSFDNEKNFNPHYMHLLISKKYDFLVLNENLCFVEYQEAGMTNSIFKQYANSPKSFCEIRRLYLSFPNTSIKFKLRNSIHYVSSCILSGRYTDIITMSPRKLYSFISIPFGIILSIFIKIKYKQRIGVK
jgi:glycosyltransferase involved in cell wall biosynthesis